MSNGFRFLLVRTSCHSPHEAELLHSISLSMCLASLRFLVEKLGGGIQQIFYKSLRELSSVALTLLEQTPKP